MPNWLSTVIEATAYPKRLFTIFCGCLGAIAALSAQHSCNVGSFKVGFLILLSFCGCGILGSYAQALITKNFNSWKRTHQRKHTIRNLSKEQKIILKNKFLSLGKRSARFLEEEECHNIEILLYKKIIRPISGGPNGIVYSIDSDYYFLLSKNPDLLEN